MEKKEKGLKILVSGFRREDLIWRIKDLLLDMVTIKHQNMPSLSCNLQLAPI